MIPGFSIGTIAINPGLVLAPMSGVTTSSFRRLIKELNPGCVGLLVSEFVSVEGMTRGSRRTIQMMRYDPSERPYSIQIFGYDIDRMRDAAKMVEDAGADILDINCGCPAPKVVRRGGGCELMRQPDHLQKVFREVRKAVSIPVTMKMRSGWDSSSMNNLEIAHMAQEEGLQAVAIHGRTRVQLYRGDADWEHVRSAASSLKIPVLGSGDVVDRASALERLATGASGLLIGRAALWNPLVFQEIATGKAIDLKRDPERCLSILLRYTELLQEEMKPVQSIGKIKQLASQMARGHKWRKELLLTQSFEDIISLLKKEYDNSRRLQPVYEEGCPA